MNAPSRIESLDWLRGMLALAIMAFHLTYWQVIPLDASTVLGRLGIYGVTMFFVLSGLSLALVYHAFFRDAGAVARFYVRRLFRILPLIWIAVALLPGIEAQPAAKIWLNVTGAFGFVAPADYINTGAWSIGNELVYYALTPALVMAYARRPLYGNLLVALSASAWLLYAFAWLTPHEPLAWQWRTYIEPLNNLFLYAAGVAIYYNIGALPRWAGATIGAASVAVFLFWPSSGDPISIVTGLARVVYSAASIGLVVFFYRLDLHLPRSFAAGLTTIGLATYGVYLLHPIVFERLKTIVAPTLLSATVIFTTVALAVVAYAFVEAPLIRLGKRLTPSRFAVSV